MNLQPPAGKGPRAPGSDVPAPTSDARAGFGPESEPTIAIVIPCLNEADAIVSSLPAAMALGCEVVVSDGGSTDGTADRARELGARVVSGVPGRGGQLNRGAAATTADVVLFLHADTRLPEGALNAVRRAVTEGADGGAFRIRFDDPRPTMRLAAWLINQRTRWTQTPLGDQGQFASRAIFERLQGFREWPILEDLDFSRRLKRLGKLVVIDRAVTTGARRFNQRGALRTIATNWLIWSLFFLGVSPQRLARLYRPIR